MLLSRAKQDVDVGTRRGLLEISRGEPLLQICRVAQTYNDVAVEYRVSLVNTAHHEYWSEIGGNG